MSRSATGLGVASLTMLVVGCTTVDPNAWLVYSRANYLYGRMEVKTELICGEFKPHPAKVTDLDLLNFCAEAERTRDAIHALNPRIQAELSKSQTDWDAIMRYLDLVLSLAGKLL